MVAFSIAGFQIHRYGIFYLIAFLCGYFFFVRLGKKASFPKEHKNLQKIFKESPEDIIFYIFLGVMIGGRLGHILIYDIQNYINNPLEILQIWKGGMSFIGGMVGVVCTMLIFKKIKKITKKDVLILLDIILSIVPLGIMLGRLGNFLNQELYGIQATKVMKILPEHINNIAIKLNIFHVYDKVDNALRINTNFIAMTFEGALILIVNQRLIRKRIKKGQYKPGQISSIFLILYSTVRFFLEYIRADSQREFLRIFTKSQRFFIMFFILGLFIWRNTVIQKKNLI